METHDEIKWHVEITLEKYGDDLTIPYQIIHDTGNLLVLGGASALWERLKGTSVIAFDNANAYFGVGDSSTAAASTQTDLQAATNKVRVAMDATYPTHTDGTGASANAQITFKSTFNPGTGTFAWNEWGIFNDPAAGRMLNRKVVSYGSKGVGDTWTLQVTIILA